MFFFKNYTMDSCIVCNQIVRPHQEALLCDGCERWQHRTCQTGISQHDYRGAVRSGNSIIWHCEDCEGTALNSTPVLFSDDDFQSMVPFFYYYYLFSAFLLSYTIYLNLGTPMISKNDFVLKITFFILGNSVNPWCFSCYASWAWLQWLRCYSRYASWASCVWWIVTAGAISNRCGTSHLWDRVWHSGGFHKAGSK